jgi:glycine/D-amino acid oxidase-like deaminating enzyme
MTSNADAVVIGSGALGASTAYYLAERNRRVVLLDKFNLASQSSARAAGLAQQVQVDDVLANLAIRGIQTLTHFEQETGVPLDVVVNGSVKIARTEDDAAQLEEEVRRGKNLGVEIDFASATQARKAAPWANPDKALALSHCTTDTYIERGRFRRRSSVASSNVGEKRSLIPPLQMWFSITTQSSP